MLDQYTVSLSLLIHEYLAWSLREFTITMKELIILEELFAINGLNSTELLKLCKLVYIPKISEEAESGREDEVSVLL